MMETGSKSMKDNKHNVKMMARIEEEVLNHLHTCCYGELILLVKVQGGVIQVCKVHKLTDDSSVKLT